MRLLKKFSLGLLLSSLGLFFLELPAKSASEAASTSKSSAANRSAQKNSASLQSFSQLLANAEAAPETAVELIEGPENAQAASGNLLSTAMAASEETLESVEPSAAADPLQVSQSLDELLEAEEPNPVIPPGNPVGAEIRNERINDEVEAEIDEVILRQVPDSRLLENLYTIEIAPADDERIDADRRSTLKLAGQVNDESGNLLNHDVVVTLTSSAGEFIGADYDIDRPGFQVLARWGEFDAAFWPRCGKGADPR